MKIGFLGMSGIRAHDAKLLELGLTLPGFVERSKQIAALPSLGLLSIAACTPPGHELAYFEATRDGDEPAAVYDCDLVAISTLTAQAFEAYAIADRLLEAGVMVCIGGLHATAVPYEALRHADFVVVGEGENVWPDVVAAAGRGATGVVFDAADHIPVDVAHLPVPRFDLLGARQYNRYTIQATRGCAWHCEFCASTVTLRGPYRKRPVDQVVRDIRALQMLYDHPFVEFADDNTFVDKRWGRELCDAIAPLGIRWFTETDISVAEDLVLLDAMREAGCRQVLVGLESPNGVGLEGLELRANRKARWAGRYADAVHTIQEHGISVNACFILGLDGQGPDVFQAVAAFADDVKPYDVQITVLTPFPGTPLYDRLLAEGRILQPGAWHLCTLFDVNFVPTGMTPDQLREGIYWLGERLYSEEATRRRRRGFISEYHSHRMVV